MPIGTVRAALEHWLAQEGRSGSLEVLEVLDKQASDHRYLSITFVDRTPAGSTRTTLARRFVTALMTRHPELGGPHLVFWGRAPVFPSWRAAQRAADDACAFARAWLDDITKTRGTHKLYVGAPTVSAAEGVIVWILRDDCDPRELDLDEHEVAAEIGRAHGGVTFRGDYCK